MKKRRNKNGSKGISWSPDRICNAIRQCLASDFPDYGALSGELMYLTNDIQALSSFRQLSEFTKKYKSEYSDKDLLKDRGLYKFVKIIQDLETFVLVLPERKSHNDVFTMSDRDKILLRAKSICSHLVGDSLDIQEWFECCKHGKGTTVGTSFAQCNLADKFVYPITVTKEALPLITLYEKWDFHFSQAIKCPEGVQPFEVVRGSRTTTVDKDDEIDRIIAIEPTANMFLQQGLMVKLYERLRPFLDFAKLPDIHRVLAMVSSITHENATIDWSSASDTVLLNLVRWFFPPCWSSAFELVRCKETTFDGVSYLTLPMVSTMGNATTFPIETVIFFSVAVACLGTGNSLIANCDDFERVSVFGDDCILPSSHTQIFIDVLTSVGFRVNQKKSFSGDISFRESCGGDFFHCRDVRPFYIRPPQSKKKSALEPWLYTVSNGLIKKYNSHFGVAYAPYSHVFQYLFSLFNEYGIKIKVVPSSFPDDSGLKIWGDEHRYPVASYSPISQDLHGTFRFLMLRFRYRNEVVDYSAAGYWSALKRLNNRVDHQYLLDVEASFARMYQRRNRGGYVVAKTTLC